MYCNNLKCLDFAPVTSSVTPSSTMEYHYQQLAERFIMMDDESRWSDRQMVWGRCWSANGKFEGYRPARDVDGLN